MELSVVLAVLGLLVATFSSYQALRKAAEVNSLIESSQSLAKAILTYSSDRGLIPGDIDSNRLVSWGSTSGTVNESLKAYQDLASQNLISMPTRADSEISFGDGDASSVAIGANKNVLSTKISGVGANIISYSATASSYYSFDNTNGSVTLLFGSVGSAPSAYGEIAGLTAAGQLSAGSTTNGEGVSYSLVVAMDGKVDSETGAAQGDLKYNPTESTNTAFGYIVRF